MHGRLSSKAWFVIVLFLFAVANVVAEKSKDTGPKYSVANEVKIKGVVEEVREVPGNFEGTHLVVKTETATVLVHVAPAAFLKEIDTTFAKGDQVQVVGAKAPNTAGTEEEILAREITVGTNTVTLRDEKGIPVWADWSPSKASGN
jgi:hypothetical protein